MEKIISAVIFLDSFAVSVKVAFAQSNDTSCVVELNLGQSRKAYCSLGMEARQIEWRQ